MIKVDMLTNLDAVGDMIGSLEGISDGVDSELYMENLIEQAHGKASHAFDLAAAATGAAGHLQHMYEFGTAGVTRGPVKFPDPTSQAARLWIHQIKGEGGNKRFGFTFRPAINRNPQPTTAYTGVASKYLRRLSKRKYLFWNKAYVVETGQSVEIKTKRVSHLFVPFGANKPARNPKYASRHFVWWHSDSKGPIVNTPGETTRGTFTGFWFKWWLGTGDKIVTSTMEKELNKDIEIAVAEASKKANAQKLKPAQSNNPKAAAAKARTRARKGFGKK